MIMIINIHFDRLKILFRVLCWLATLLIICYWIYRYDLNEDVCIIDYKKYYHRNFDAFPVLSICLKNPFSKTKFRMKNQATNDTLYKKFLKGEYFSTRFMKLDYSDIRLNLSDYVDQYYFEWRNGSTGMYIYENKPIEIFSTTFAGFYNSEFYHCYGLQTPHDNQITQFAVLIQNNIFPFGFRSTNYDMLALLHYPNQLLTSYKTLKNDFSRQGPESSSSMRFQVRGVEILQGRNKKSRPCNEDWQNYDNNIIKDHLNYVGCRAPYQGNKSYTLPLCSNQERMKKALMILKSYDDEAETPCRSMEKIDYTYSENDMTDTKYCKKGSFWVSYYIYNPQCKEIVQSR